MVKRREVKVIRRLGTSSWGDNFHNVGVIWPGGVKVNTGGITQVTRD